MVKNILIIGATSCIAESYAQLCAKNGDNLFLVGRDLVRLNVIKKNLMNRGAKRVEIFKLDLNDYKNINPMINHIKVKFNRIDVALIAHGSLTNQDIASNDLNYLVKEYRNNSESVIVCLSLLARYFDHQGYGTIAVIGSVAGDRGRLSNYSYAASKAAIETFCSGLRVKMFKRGVNLLLIKPGFVATPMTAKITFPSFLVANPEIVAQDIYQSIIKKKDVVYTPWFWYFIMAIIRKIPQFIFRKTNF